MHSRKRSVARRRDESFFFVHSVDDIVYYNYHNYYRDAKRDELLLTPSRLSRPSSPVRAVEGTIANRFGSVPRSYLVRVFEVGYRATDLQYPVISPR